MTAPRIGGGHVPIDPGKGTIWGSDGVGNAAAVRAPFPAYSNTASTISAETLPRWAIQSTTAIPAGSAVASRISLVPGSYTTVTLGTTTQGVTLANSFLALYDSSLSARLAVSADISTALAAVLINTTGTFTLNYTCTTAGDFFLALLVGSASTMPTPFRGSAIVGSMLGTLVPRVAGRSSAANLTSLADPFPAISDAQTVPHYWMRYE